MSFSPDRFLPRRTIHKPNSKITSRARRLRGKARYLGILVGLAIISQAFVLSASARPGDLDLTFGVGGKVTLRLTGLGDSFRDVAIQSDGKIVAAGNDGFYAVLLARYNTNGTPDTTFDGDGLVLTTPGGISVATAIAIQPDGKIVVVGSVRVANQNDWIVLRYHTNGSLDSSFNGNGLVVTQLSNGQDLARDVEIQPDGKIVVIGQANDGGRTAGEFALARYNTNGSLDTDFDGDGKVFTSIGTNGDHGFALKLRPDGKIVAAGYTFDELPGSYLMLVRYNSNGSIDTGFDGDGMMLIDFGDQDAMVSDLVIQSDGKFIISISIGSNGSFVYAFSAMRFLPDGGLDPGFGSGGLTIITVGNVNSAQSLALQRNGKVVIVGHAPPAGVGGLDIQVSRLNSNGTLDTTFGNGGRVNTPVGSNGDYGLGVAIQSDGKIVVAGEYNVAGLMDYDAVVIRYLASNTRFDFDGNGTADMAVFRSESQAGGVWYIRGTNESFTTVQWGLGTDKIVPADYDGDGKTDVAVFRDGAWYVLKSSTNSLSAYNFGLSGDLPVPADYDADGNADVAVFRGGDWYVLQSSNSAVTAQSFGVPTDRPVIGDFDGDGKSDLVVYRDGIWYLQQSQLGFTAYSFGLASDKPVAADYDGDGKTDYAVFRDGIWYLQQSTQGFGSRYFGLSTDKLVPADYDGDGKADVAVFRDGAWYVSRSSDNATSAIQFGVPGDIPVPSAFVP